ncbi:unnamed protein product, partial [Brenthis ino]
MSGVGALNVTGGIPRMSPVTFSSEWPKIARLLFMLFCSSFGSTMNGFFVASFFIEHTLKQIGNVFLALVGMADMIITTCIMPVCTVILLSGQWDNLYVCKSLHFLAITSTYCYSLYFLLVAADNYYRFCRSADEYEVFISMRIGLISFSIFLLSVLLAAGGVFLGLDYDYCEREHYGNFYFRITTMVVFHAVPALLTIICMFSTTSRIMRRARQHGHYKRSQMFERDRSMNASNIVAFLLYVISWTPYIIVVYEFPGTSDNKYYSVVWIGLLRSIITSFMYGTVNRSFRRAFAHLFNYCFCKSTLSSSFTGRHRRAMEYKSGTGEVKVHIMHQTVNTSSPQRGTSAIRETQEL